MDICRSGFFVGLFCLLAPVGAADEIGVPGDCRTIQAGIDAAKEGDTVLVDPGTYFENIDFKGKAITVKSRGGAERTVIDGGQPVDPRYGSVVHFENREGRGSVLDGFKLINGTGTEYRFTFKQFGGGINCYNASPTIINNIIAGNSCTWLGGGIFCGGDSSALIRNNRIVNNTAVSRGGGISFEVLFNPDRGAPTIEDNLIEGNSVVDSPVYYPGGGGICYNYGSSAPCHGAIVRNRIIGNAALPGDGGGVIVFATRGLVFSHNLIMDNVAKDGSGGGIFSSNVTVASNRILNNRASLGGGLYWFGSIDEIALMNNVIADNAADLGGGIFWDIGNPDYPTAMHFVNNTITGNDADKGGGIYLFYSIQKIRTLAIRNSILWANDAAEGREIFLTLQSNGATLKVSHCDLGGGLSSIHAEPDWTIDWGPGMIDLEPLFKDEGNMDYHLTYPSPCRDSGDQTVNPLPVEDFEGDPRVVGKEVDMGADEFLRP